MAMITVTTTIQAAIDGASSGDTIFIPNGTYAEQISIAGKTGLILQGASETGVIITSPASLLQQNAVDATTGRPQDALISVSNSSNITIENLKVDGADRGNDVAGGNDFVGIAVANSTGTIDHVDVSGIRDALVGGELSGVQRGNAIVISNAAPQAFTVSNSSVENYQKTAIIARNTTVTLTGNDIDGGGPHNVIAQNGIQLSSGSTGSVIGNHISGIGFTPNTNEVVGILVFDSHGSLNITGNTFNGTDTNDAFTYLQNSSGVTVSGNTINNTDQGIIDFGTTPVTTGGNTYNGTAGDDVLHGGPGNDHIDGLGGIDTLDMSAAGSGGAIVNLTSGLAVSIATGIDTVVNVENALGSSGNDTLIGDGNANTFYASGGADNIDGRGGLDTYDASSSTSSVLIDLDGGYAAGSVNANLTSIENATGGSGDDFLAGGLGANILAGNAGNNSFFNLHGGDVVHGGTGLDTAVFFTNVSAATFGPGPGGALAVTIAGETVTFDSVEKLQFNDHNVLVVGTGGQYATIQAAIDAASDGDTIVVTAGTYNENVTITDKALNIVGMNHGTDGASHDRGAESIILGQVQVTGSKDVLFDGLEFMANGTTNTTGPSHPALGFHGSGNYEVENSVFFNATAGGANGVDARAISLDTSVSGAVTITHNSFTGSSVGNFGTASWGRGIWSDGTSSDLDITGNSFANVRSGINLDGYNDATHHVSGNTFVSAGSGISVGIPTGSSFTGIHDNDFQSVGDDFNFQNLTTPVNIDLTATANASSGGTAGLGGGVIQVLGSQAGDHIKGSAGADSIIANGGDDVVTGGAGNDTIQGGSGTDTVDYSVDGGSGAVTVNLATGTATDTFGNTDTLSSIENAIGTSLADTFTSAASGVNTFTGGGGNDTYNVKAGDVVVETNNGGTDLVQTTDSYTLGVNVENLTLQDKSGANLSHTETFDNLPLGPIANGANGGVNGWQIPGYMVDQAVVTDPHNRANKVFHISSDPSNGAFGGPFSPALGAAAGEADTGAAFNGQSISFNFQAVNATPDGSRLEVDFGNAAGTDRNNFLVIESFAGQGIRIAVSEPDLSGNFSGDGSDPAPNDWRELVTGVDPTTQHTLEMRLDYVDGANNDVIGVYLDGNLIGETTTFENYHDALGGSHIANAQANLTDRVIFRESNNGQTQDGSGTGANQGFYFDNLTTSVYNNTSGTGNGLDNVITGNSGDNLLTGLGGNDTINGGLGIDTAAYQDARSNYAISVSTDSHGRVTGFSQVQETGPNAAHDGTDGLTSIERLQFSDVTLDVNQRVQLFDSGNHLIGTFDSIQAAINAGADGDLIRLAAGAYDESVTLDKNIEIDGVNSGTSGTGVRGAESIIRGQMTVTAAHSNAGHVTINGVEIYNTSDATHAFTGINVTSGADVTVSNSVFFSPVAGSGSANDRGIQLTTGATGTIDIVHNLFTSSVHNAFSTAAWTSGIWSDGAQLGGTIDSNTFEFVRTGINADDFNNSLAITHNTFQNSGSGVSIGVGSDVSNITSIQHNTFSNVDTDFNLKNVTTPIGFDLTATDNQTSGVSSATVLGSTAGDHITGSAGNDVIFGNGGDDVIDGGAGNDTIDGGDGVDTYMLSGAWSDYSISRVGATYTITKGGETDTVTNVENFNFNGHVMSVVSDPDVIASLAPAVQSIVETGADEDSNPATIAVAENTANGTAIATVSATDHNIAAGDVLTFALVDGSGNPYTGPFTITKNPDGVTATIAVAGALNFEAASSFAFQVKITDSAGHSVTQAVPVFVLDVNEAPTDISLSHSSFGDQQLGAVVGNLTALDPDAGDSVTFTVNDSRFEIVTVGGQKELKLKDAVTLDFAHDPHVYHLGVTATDSGGLQFTKNIDVNLIDTNLAPVAPQASNVTVESGVTEALLADPNDNPLHLGLPVDPEGDTLTFHLAAIQPTAGHQGGTVLLNGVPVVVGTQTLSASDMQNLHYLAPVTGDASLETVTLNFSYTDGTNTGNMAVNVNITPAVDGTFVGTAGADRFDGGAGNDTYTVNNTGDVVLEQANAGTDTIQIATLSSWTLGANIENLTHTGSNTFTGTGNSLDNVLSGGSGDDTLIGGGGNDTLNGGTGGSDTAQYSGAHGDYLITRHAGGTTYTVQDMRAGSADGTDTLSNIAQLKFSDGTFAINDTAGTILHDFDGNGHSDIVLVGNNGSATVWNNGAESTAHQIAGAGIISNGWHLAGTGDFDDNGKADFVFVNDNGTASIWNNGDIGTAHIIAPAGIVSNGWQFAGTGDFDGNGKSDILWVNNNGTASIWNNGDMGAAHIIAPAGTVSNGWHFAGTGDFDGNGKSDILWVNNNGTASIWNNGDMGTAHIIAPAGTVSNGWHFAGTGDFDGSGKSDILFVNDNGSASIWNNGDMNTAHFIAPAGTISNGWHFANTGDYDGNGHTDILWRNDNGLVSIWDNGQIANAHIIASSVTAASGLHIV